MATRKPIAATALYPVLAVASPRDTAAALAAVTGMTNVFDSDWFVQLLHQGNGMQLGLVRFDHDSVPPGARSVASGVFVTIDVEDAQSAWQDWRDDLEIVHPLTDEAWGQRQFIARMPGDILVDFVQMLDG